MEEGESHCPSCERPARGEPRNAPAGSDARSQPPETPTLWNAAFWIGLAVAAAAAVLVALLG